MYVEEEHNGRDDDKDAADDDDGYDGYDDIEDDGLMLTCISVLIFRRASQSVVALLQQQRPIDDDVKYLVICL